MDIYDLDPFTSLPGAYDETDNVWYPPCDPFWFLGLPWCWW
jgi:hypothetical protein